MDAWSGLTNHFWTLKRKIIFGNGLDIFFLSFPFPFLLPFLPFICQKQSKIVPSLSEPTTFIIELPGHFHFRAHSCLHLYCRKTFSVLLRSLPKLLLKSDSQHNVTEEGWGHWEGARSQGLDWLTWLQLVLSKPGTSIHILPCLLFFLLLHHDRMQHVVLPRLWTDAGTLLLNFLTPKSMSQQWTSFRCKVPSFRYFSVEIQAD